MPEDIAIAPPAPAAPPAAAPSPDPSSPEPSPGGSDPFMDEFNSVFDREAPIPKKDEPKPEPKAKDQPAAPKPEPKGEPKPPAPTFRRQGDDKLPPKFRDELYKTQDELKALAEQKTALETKVKEGEERGKNVDALNSKLEAMEKETQRLQSELHTARFETSKEYKEKYEKPINDFVEDATASLSRILKTDGTKADFWADFVPIHRLAQVNWNEANDKAEEVFGPKGALVVMGKSEQLERLEKVAKRVKESEQTNWSENKKKIEEEARLESVRKAKSEEENQALMERARKEIRDKNPDYQDPVDDKELIEARQKGEKELKFQPKTAAQHAAWMAHMHHRAASFHPQRLIISRQASRIKELEEQVAGKKNGAPNPSPRNPGGQPVEQPKTAWNDADLINAVKS